MIKAISSWKSNKHGLGDKSVGVRFFKKNTYVNWRDQRKRFPWGIQILWISHNTLWNPTFVTILSYMYGNKGLTKKVESLVCKIIQKNKSLRTYLHLRCLQERKWVVLILISFQQLDIKLNHIPPLYRYFNLQICLSLIS